MSPDPTRPIRTDRCPDQMAHVWSSENIDDHGIVQCLRCGALGRWPYPPFATLDTDTLITQLRGEPDHVTDIPARCAACGADDNGTDAVCACGAVLAETER